MENNKISMVWVGERISPIEALCMKSYIANGHEVDLYAYSHIEGVPKDINIRDANEIIPLRYVFMHRGSYAAFADLFRWKLMVMCGGYYVDTDVLCLRHFDFQESAVLGYEAINRLTPTVLGFDNNSPDISLAKDMLEVALNPLRWQIWDSNKMKLKKILKRFSFRKVHAIGWGYTAGPIGLTNCFNTNKYDIKPYGIDTFYPVPYESWMDFIKPDILDFDSFKSNSYSVHLWNEMWRRGGVDKFGDFDKRSFVYKAMERYL